MKPTYTRPVPWAQIHGETFLYEDQCWTTCNGGFCCSNNHPDFQFQLIPTHGTTILYMEEEYAWLARHAKVPDPQEFPPNQVALDYGGPRPLTLIQMPCRLLGKCHGVIDKPLLCKIYPMLPVLSIDGKLEDIVSASIFELTMLLRGIKTPCTVVDKTRHYVQKWQKRPEALAALNHPYIILYLQAARHFGEIYAEKLHSNETLRGLNGKTFWQTWEIEFLLGNLVDGPKLAEKVLQTYDSLVERYGHFLPETEQTAVSAAA
jgi:hypothetical protein